MTNGKSIWLLVNLFPGPVWSISSRSTEGCLQKSLAWPQRTHCIERPRPSSSTFSTCQVVARHNPRPPLAVGCELLQTCGATGPSKKLDSPWPARTQTQRDSHSSNIPKYSSGWPWVAVTGRRGSSSRHDPAFDVRAWSPPRGRPSEMLLERHSFYLTSGRRSELVASDVFLVGYTTTTILQGRPNIHNNKGATPSLTWQSPLGAAWRVATVHSRKKK